MIWRRLIGRRAVSNISSVGAVRAGQHAHDRKAAAVARIIYLLFTPRRRHHLASTTDGDNILARRA